MLTVETAAPNMEGRSSSPRAWVGTARHPMGTDVAERTGDTGPRLLCAPRRIHLCDGSGEPGPSRAELETIQV